MFVLIRREASARQAVRRVQIQLLVGETGRRVERVQRLKPLRPPAGLLLELAPRRLHRIFAGLELARRNFDLHLPERLAVLLDDDQPVVVQREHRGRARVL